MEIVTFVSLQFPFNGTCLLVLSDLLNSTVPRNTVDPVSLTRSEFSFDLSLFFSAYDLFVFIFFYGVYYLTETLAEKLSMGR